MTGIALPELTCRHVYSGRESRHRAFDSVVLACGGLSETKLFEELDGKVAQLHVLGDAWAPRRITFATQQGHELGKAL